MRRICSVVTALSILVLAFGCGPKAPLQSPVTTAHSHSHEALGPNGGHLLPLGDEEYHLEWKHDDDAELVTLFVLDGAAKELVPIEADSITISVKVEETTNYTLLAVDPSGEPPRSSQFQLKNAELIAMLGMAGQGAEPKVTVPIGGKEFVGVFEHHDHH